ncbi:MAG: STAS domain-containing protein [Chitinivibrionales bacterium]|nr:STAS domain-containing protein [Chitinivibrionales bacterium]
MRMAIDKYSRNGFQIFRITDTLGLQSNIADLEELIRDALEQGERRIAISFTPASRLYSNTISVLIRCISHAEERGVKLTLVVPNEHIMISVRLVGLVGMVDICGSEERLGAESEG